MFTSNPFAEISAYIAPAIMQTFVIVMIILVVAGTLFDVLHKRSAEYFFNAARKAKDDGDREVTGGEKVGLAVKTVASDVLTSSEFCNPHRRIAHLLGMYGFVFYLVATIAMVFGYASTGAETPSIWPFLWYLGALMVCVGGYWFWFFIRVDVAAEGSSPFRIVRADLFILSLVASATFGLIWALLQLGGIGVWSNIFLGLYLIATVVLFAGVPWSKFAHMFFKPAAAFQKKVGVANGSMANLPQPADRTSAADRDRHSMELLKDAPLNMGLGIKREKPRHY
ncbi:MAG: adenylyl-sulfate reductase [Rhizobiaceae bacterium]|nr:adenylyl-sulfate reductase [Rhizobiaceae bacterium]